MITMLLEHCYWQLMEQWKLYPLLVELLLPWVMVEEVEAHLYLSLVEQGVVEAFSVLAVVVEEEVLHLRLLEQQPEPFYF